MLTFAVRNEKQAFCVAFHYGRRDDTIPTARGEEMGVEAQSTRPSLVFLKQEI